VGKRGNRSGFIRIENCQGMIMSSSNRIFIQVGNREDLGKDCDGYGIIIVCFSVHCRE